MKLQHWIIVLPLVMGMPFSSATPDPPPVPTAPLVRRAPEFASWTVQIRKKAEEGRQATAASRPDCLTVTKTNQTYREQMTTGSGEKLEKWTVEHVQFLAGDNDGTFSLISPPNGEDPSPEYFDFGESDFEGLGWVSLENYKGVKDYHGAPAFFFESTTDGKTALLSTSTQLPLFSDDRFVARSYTYNRPPSTPLVLPAGMLKIVETNRRGLEALKIRPSLP